ncbi:Shikimate kinase [Candidatus Desulfarcum epimagneticum]|uniref:Shikimate kinase n=1 Tax=uncultured Desulfobacteraceae bacterium TaxID=218296 RepID=A0A484HDK4_9BACT|nr:Shikimate kinase [uncultured Desulfobacteraceae bacterium]
MVNIYLIGCRCAGKTGAGQALARRLGRPFRDSDLFVEEKNRMSVAAMVSERGWEAFRRAERDAVREICREKDIVAAMGGGVVLDKKNVADMKKTGILIWLRAAPETVRRRMEKDRRTESLRPSLTGAGALEEIGEVLERRDPLCRAAADVRVDTDHLGVGEAAETALEKIRPWGIFETESDKKGGAEHGRAK